MTINFLALNEVNFDLIEKYEERHPLPGMQLLRSLQKYTTYNDVDYHELEPWIQWVTVHTGLKSEDHGIFRLGDLRGQELDQFFEHFDNLGYEICAISPMNAFNKIDIEQIFIPDPWTETGSDQSFWSRQLIRVLRQTVNDNSSGKVSINSYIILILASVRFMKFSWYVSIVKLAISMRQKKWNKALILDTLLYNIFIKRRSKNLKGFNYLFLNSFAHIQHHYLLNSPYVDVAERNPEWYVDHKSDPVFDAIKIFDKILYDFLSRCQNEHVIIATGLTQVPYDKAKFYYRLSDHESFLKDIGLDFIKVRRGMTRDFHVDFSSNYDRDIAFAELDKLTLKDKKLFGDFSISEKSLFCSFTYPDEIGKNDILQLKKKNIVLINVVNFVAIKNGIHHDKGFVFLNSKDGFKKLNVPLYELNNYVKSLD